MSYISNSVGKGGTNLVSDVKVIQWMLIRAQDNYPVIFGICYGIRETGTVDVATASAIQQFIKYSKKARQSKAVSVASLPTGNTNIAGNVFTDSTIQSNGEHYEYLLKCTLKPVCKTPNNTKVDFHTDSLIAQALNNRISFEQFKKATIAKDSHIWKKQSKGNFVGINPVTRKPGINAVSSGKIGELRSGVGGNGNYKARTGNKHDAIDIRAPRGTPIYAFLEGAVK